jgi:hypothetical protein
VYCVATASDHTGTIVAGIGVGLAAIGVIVALIALVVSLRALNIAREEHGLSVTEHKEFLRQITARADIVLTAGLLPDMGDTYVLQASAAIIRVQIGLQNVGDKAAGETTVEVLLPGGLTGLYWSDRGGTQLPTDSSPARERLPLPQGGEAAAQLLTRKIARVPRGAPEYLWMMFTVASAPAEIVVRIKARSDDLATENTRWSSTSRYTFARGHRARLKPGLPPRRRNPRGDEGSDIGAPGFEPGTSPTRITRATRPGTQELPANRAFWRRPTGTSDPRIYRWITGDWAQKCALCPIADLTSSVSRRRLGPLPTASPAAVRAADQLPHTAVITLADGRLRSFSRCSPLRRAARASVATRTRTAASRIASASPASPQARARMSSVARSSPLI